MREEEQIDALYAELEKVLYHFQQEFDLSRKDIVWVLQLLQEQLADVDLDFESEWEDE
jgi:hypothetical protein